MSMEEKWKEDPFVTPIDNLCDTCIRRNEDMVTCEAFPEGIPVAILLGVFDHTHSYDVDGYSDNGITYYPKDPAYKLIDKLIES